MDDKHLLEMAAKAVGIELAYDKNRKMFKVEVDGRWMKWNPLNNDSDAFRLMVALNLQVTQDTDYDLSMAASKANILLGEAWNESYIGECQYAATRRVIVRCAAEIGEGL